MAFDASIPDVIAASTEPTSSPLRVQSPARTRLSRPLGRARAGARPCRRREHVALGRRPVGTHVVARSRRRGVRGVARPTRRAIAAGGGVRRLAPAPELVETVPAEAVHLGAHHVAGGPLLEVGRCRGSARAAPGGVGPLTGLRGLSLDVLVGQHSAEVRDVLDVVVCRPVLAFEQMAHRRVGVDGLDVAAHERVDEALVAEILRRLVEPHLRGLRGDGPRGVEHPCVARAGPVHRLADLALHVGGHRARRRRSPCRRAG